MAKQVERPKPRLSNLDELFKINEKDGSNPTTRDTTASAHDVANQDKDTTFTTLSFSLMDDFDKHPFRLYDGERKSDMVDSIRDKGILQPLILRSKENGRYEILSGHNRKYCGIEAGRSEAPVIIKKNLSDDEAWIYVIETNLLQRSFSDMLPSEKAVVLSLMHSKLFSQGKRNDILEEIKRLENPHDEKENSTSSQLAKKLTSIEKVGNEYSLSKDTVARYLRINQLTDNLKMRLDNCEIAFIPAVTLSFIKENEQNLLDKCIDLNGFKVDMKKADILRRYSERGKLDEDNIYLILNGELGQPPKKKRTPTFKIKPKVYSLYFVPGQKASEVEDVIEKALALYFGQTRNREQETIGSKEQSSFLSDDESDHEYDDGIMM